MSVSVSGSIGKSVSSSDCSASFAKEVNNMHRIGFKKDLENDENNYFNASLHCLTNIKSLSFFIISSAEQNSCYMQLVTSCFKGDNEINSKEINDNVNNLKKYIFETLQYNKEDNKPKDLIDFLLKDLKRNKLLPVSIIYNFQYKCNICKKISEENNELKFIEFNIPEIINCYNNKNKITIYDCFHYYFKSLNNENSIYFCENCQGGNFEILLKNLQDDLIIFIDYGKDKNVYNISYEFEETINLKDFNNINGEGKDKEFFLSSFIACINMGYPFETFYTFSREKKDSKYYMFNGMEVKPNMKVDNKLKKEKIDLKNMKESWPVVLVYTKNI